ncbi:MAG: triose-phosphate isomerase [Formosimonas sp.]
MRTQWVIGNWKMNGDLASNAALIKALHSTAGITKMAVCVPFTHLAQVQALLQGSAVQLAAQDISQFEKGAYTGEISANMLKEFGVQLVLTGHSERRHIYGENDEMVAAKTLAAMNAGLTPIVCLGETLDEREAGLAQAVVLRQLNAVIAQIGAENLSKSILAYEPVWAIGTGKTASPAQAQEVHSWLRAALTAHNAAGVSILYGGSVKASNAAEIFGQPDVDGGLIGGAALIAEDFLGIYNAI